MPGTPQRVLLATDLGARCDRALDRAAQLAEQWRAKLLALHVLEPGGLTDNGTIPSWRRQRDASVVAEVELRADLMTERLASIALVEEGDPPTVVARVAAERACDLIVTGVARDEALGRFSLGATVDRLVRQTTVPLLIVKNRTRGPYRNIVAAIDFSPASRQALKVVSRFFPGHPISLFHAFEAPFLGFAANADRQIGEFRDMAASDCERFLTAIASEGIVIRRRETLIEHGAPAALLRSYAWDKGMDLVVIGTNARGPVMDMLVGSTARSILGELPCDALVLREPAA